MVNLPSFTCRNAHRETNDGTTELPYPVSRSQGAIRVARGDGQQGATGAHSPEQVTDGDKAIGEWEHGSVGIASHSLGLSVPYIEDTLPSSPTTPAR